MNIKNFSNFRTTFCWNFNAVADCKWSCRSRIIINAEKIHFTGNKFLDKKYYKHTGYPGGIKSTTPEKILAGKFPERVIQKAVRRMMPTGPLSNTQFGNIKVYAGSEHPHEAQNPQKMRV